MFSLKWQPDDSFNIVLRADISAEHDTGSTYHDLGYFVGTVPSAGRTSICNIPGDLRRLHRSAAARSIAPYYLTATATSVSNPNPSPQAYNSMLASVAREQNYGFWSAEQDAQQSQMPAITRPIRPPRTRASGISMCSLMAAYRTLDNIGTAVSRGLPFETNTYIYNFAQLSILAVGIDRQRQAPSTTS